MLLPIIFTIYLTKVVSYDKYIFYTLALIILVRLRGKWVPIRYQSALFLVEICYIAWLFMHYNGIIFVVFCSSLISLFQLQYLRSRNLWIVFTAILMNYTAATESLTVLLFANILFFATAFFLIYAQHMSVGREELQSLYDELKRKHYELDEARERLLDYAKIVESSAQIEERNRISHDIHDDLGHKLIRLKMMMEAIIQILPQQQEKGMQMIHQVRDQLTESMETLRLTLRRMKPDETVSHSFSIDKLVEDLSQDNHIQASYEISGIPYPLYPSCEIVIYRNAQEAITNAIRHGKATEISIRLHYEPKQITLQVSNNGLIPAKITQKGIGLSGMEERTYVLGGKLRFEYSVPFTVSTIIPVMQNN